MHLEHYQTSSHLSVRSIFGFIGNLPNGPIINGKLKPKMEINEQCLTRLMVFLNYISVMNHNKLFLSYQFKDKVYIWIVATKGNYEAI